MPNAKRREPKLLETVGLQTHETMQWTPELDALLNQCAFSAGYDFAATCDALRLRAERLRVDCSGLSAAACEQQWMLLNPVVEDDNIYGPEDDPAEETDPCAWMVEGLASDSSPAKHGDSSNSWHEPSKKTEEVREHEATGCSACEGSATGSSISYPDEEDAPSVEGTPQLELSISDAELDQLLRELPANDEDMPQADGKQSREKSEMQWVLAFLTDPDAAANVDAEAKQFAAIANTSDIHDDDNYKGFLKDMNDAKLLSASPKKLPNPRKPKTTPASSNILNEQEESQPNPVEEESDDDSDDEAWFSMRLQVKQRGEWGS